MNNLLMNIFGRNYRKRSGTEILEFTQLGELMKQGAVLIDVRSPQEYKEGHLEGAISIPEYEIKRKIELQVRDKGTKVILYCNSGRRSRKAADLLKRLGYNNVYNLIQGIYNY